MKYELIIDVDSLRARLGGPDCGVVDCRFDLADPGAVLPEGTPDVLIHAAVSTEGDRAALAAADKVVEASYYYPFVSHCNLEPQVATALYHESGRLEMWAPTQNPRGARGLIARTLDLPEENILLSLRETVAEGGGVDLELPSRTDLPRPVDLS